MNPTCSQYAQASSDAYDPAAKWDHEWRIDGVHVCHRKIEDVDLFAFEGTKAPEDFIRDAEVFPVWHPMLGFIHAGFLHGEDDVYKSISQVAGKRNCFTGHSLGGAEARVQAGMFVVMGIPVEEVHVFGSPRPGFANLRRVIEKSGMRHVSWRNRNDPIPCVPGILPLWEHTEAPGGMDQAAAPGDFSPVRDHHVKLYLAGAALVTS